MNSEVDTEPSLQMHKLHCAYFFLFFFFFWGGGGRGVVHSAQETTQFVDHKLPRIIQKSYNDCLNTL